MEVSAEDFDNLEPYRLKKNKKPTAILFKMTTCPHCIAVMPMWKQVRQKILFMNVRTFTIDASPKNMMQYEKIKKTLKGDDAIAGFPTFVFYNPGCKGIKKLEGSGVTFQDVLEMSMSVAK